MKPSPETVRALESATVETSGFEGAGFVLRLFSKKTDREIREMGGVWSTRAKAYIFAEDPLLKFRAAGVKLPDG